MLVIRTVHEQLCRLVPADAREEMQLDRPFAVFATVNALSITPGTEEIWEVRSSLAC